MTYLELYQEMVKLSGISATVPSSVTSQTGRLADALGYIAKAHEEIQNKHFDWFFLWNTATITTVSGTSTYNGESDLGIWDRVNYDGNRIRVLEWYDYVATDLDNDEPAYAVIRPDQKLLIVPTPDAVYSLPYDYYRKPLVLSGAADEPYIPDQFQMIIIGRALMMYANFESAEEIKLQGSEIYSEHLAALEKHQLSRRQQFSGRAEASSMVVRPE